MSQHSAGATLFVRANPFAESESLDSASFHRRAPRAGTALASALRGILSPALASAYVQPPVDGLPVPVSHDASGSPGAGSRFGWLFGRRDGQDHPGCASRPPRLMPSDADRPVNVMPSHAMAAGGRPVMMEIPGK